MIVQKEILTSVSNRLNLPVMGYEQDWAVELSDKNRISEFMDFILVNNLSLAERYAVIELILCSYEDYLSYQTDNLDIIWTKIVHLLNSNKSDYDDSLNYWAMWQETNEANLFNLTQLVRKYLKKNQ